MTAKTIIGLYVGARRLQIAALSRNRFRPRPIRIEERFPDLSAGLPESGIAGLRDLLRRIPPHRGIDWYLALPRDGFFFRKVDLPAMPIEDAFDAVLAMVHTLVHLPVDDIYIDVQIGRKPDRTLRALLVYAPKKRIDPYRDVFRETGHEARLKAVFPFTIGVAAYLSVLRYPFPVAVDISYTTGKEVAVFDRLGCRSTYFSDAASRKDWDRVLRSQGLDAEPVLSIEDGTLSPGWPEASSGTVPPLPDMRENRAAAALACVLSSLQVVSVDGRKTRLKLFPFWKVVGAAVGALVLGCSVWSLLAVRTIDRNHTILTELRERRVRLEQQVQPLERNKQSAEKARGLLADIDAFMQQRPNTYRLINDIADRVPEGTWFSRFTLSEKDISLQGQSKDAIKVLEALRASPFVDQVKLSGSVTKAPNGLEQFTMSMKRKEEPSGDHGASSEQPHQ